MDDRSRAKRKMKPKLSRCPKCGTAVEPKHVELQAPFRCPVCDRYLCVPYSYSRSQILASLVISGFISFLFGARGMNLALATMLAFVPVLFVVIFWTMHFVPPALKPCQSPHSGTLGLTDRQDDNRHTDDSNG